jgi:hypothetical protein
MTSLRKGGRYRESSDDKDLRAVPLETFALVWLNTTIGQFAGSVAHSFYRTLVPIQENA